MHGDFFDAWPAEELARRVRDCINPIVKCGADGRPGSGPAGSAYTPTDVAWLQLTIAMDRRVLVLLDLAPGRAGDPAVRALAAEVSRARTAEPARTSS